MSRVTDCASMSLCLGSYCLSASLCLGSLIVFDLLVHQTEGDIGSSSTSVSEASHAVDTTVVTSVSEPAVNVCVSTLLCSSLVDINVKKCCSLYTR